MYTCNNLSVIIQIPEVISCIYTACILHNLSMNIQLGIHVPEEIGRLPWQTGLTLPLTLVLGIEDWKSEITEAWSEVIVQTTFNKLLHVKFIWKCSYETNCQNEIYMNISKKSYHVNFTFSSHVANSPVYLMTDMCTSKLWSTVHLHKTPFILAYSACLPNLPE